MDLKNIKISIIGAGNIGTAIVNGLLRSGQINAGNMILTRRNTALLERFTSLGIKTGSDNIDAVKDSDVIIIAVLPKQFESVVNQISGSLDPDKHILVSVVTAITIDEIKALTGPEIRVVRAMPNIAISVGESMTCLSAMENEKDALEIIKNIFTLAGNTIIINEHLMGAATILGACGIAFFMRYVRAASQGGIQVGFHASDALAIAAQTARGATKLLMESGNHPETEIDKVTTPMGCTITGLNEMEHNGLSSALIKGIVTSFNEISKLK